MTKKEFATAYWQFAQKAANGTSIYPLTIMGAAATESGWGESGLTKEANNFFGIKSTPAWEAKGGQYVVKRTREVVGGKEIFIDARFRKYPTAYECFVNYVEFVSGPRYVKAGVLEALNPEEQISKIQKAGYATDPQYAKTITAVIAGLKPLVS